MAGGLISKFTSVSGATLMSRVLGFVRESLMAAALGAGPAADAFYAAFRFPNLFRRLFAEGAFNAAFVPLFSREIEEHGREGAQEFSREVFGILFSALVVLTIAMELAMPLLVRFVIAPGFVDDPEKFNLTWTLAAIMFPYLMCMSLAAMMSGILTSLHHYFVAAIAPVFLNVILIAVLLVALYTGADPVRTSLELSWGVLVAGIVQLAIVVIAVRRQNIIITFRRPRLTPSVKRLLALAAPAAITGGITQINLVIGQAIASTMDGAIAIINYADRIFQLPLGIITNAIGVVLLAELSRTIRAGNEENATHLQNRSIEFGLALVLPAMVGFLIIPEALLALVYERGAFTRETTLVSAGVLAGFAAGLPAFTLTATFLPAFYSREDMRTPMWGAAANAATNIVVSLILFPIYGPAGIAVATSIAGWVNALFLGYMLWRRNLFRPSSQTLGRVLRIAIATAATGAFLFWFNWAFGMRMLDGMVGERILLVAAAIGGAMLLYFSLALAIGAIDRSYLKALANRLRSRRSGGTKGGGGA